MALTIESKTYLALSNSLRCGCNAGLSHNSWTAAMALLRLSFSSIMNMGATLALPFWVLATDEAEFLHLKLIKILNNLDY